MLDERRIKAHTGGWFVVEEGLDSVGVYHEHAGCIGWVATIASSGELAFATILLGSDPEAPPGISLDTWLFHGDRRRRELVWNVDAYIQDGRDEEIPGPHRQR